MVCACQGALCVREQSKGEGLTVTGLLVRQRFCLRVLEMRRAAVCECG